MDKLALQEVGKKTIIDIELKVEVINQLLPLLNQQQRDKLTELLSDLSPFYDSATLFLDKQPGVGENNERV
ncbi:hypothetical protein [Tatumella citrea]|uniref:Uncharacterized protein n=1 Tax=Tatumella citrea TaxID=53336 RepID=A0A1Y0L9Z9_TATCI|nr:hypothetical protein [Tatumella citrea]ARU94767.1 hypothetical protein A7K98_13970 [Tatumella citrea]ARU98805.1 hypothetical protein A7K99_13955 [Tatumella citrea]